MRHLVLYAHPTRESFNGAILQTYINALKERGHEIDIRDVYRLDFDPKLTWEAYRGQLAGNYDRFVKEEWRFWARADAVTLIFPLWWGGLPALAKGYLDRVLAYGLAYQLDGEEPIPLLGGKQSALIYTSGTPKELFDETGMSASIRQTLEEAVFQFCGMETAGVLHFGNAVLATSEEHNHMLQEVKAFAARFF
ncbi:MAG TPA: NAD(P)H-dependent oxidoreductase [Bacillales bacterium]|nr:NAD(P)H-dependent oxidoreductase [Bacillales bacterium]